MALRFIKEKKDEDKLFVRDTQAQGGVSFVGEHYARFGNHYRTTVHIQGLPDTLGDFWLYQLTSRPNVITTVDYKQETHINYLPKLQQSTDYMLTKAQNATSVIDREDYQKEAALLVGVSNDMKDRGETIKKMDIRLTLTATTLEELEEKTNALLLDLNNSGFTGAVYLNRQKFDWQSLFLSFDKQRRFEPIHKDTLELQSRAISESFAHNQTYLHDETGFLAGHTQTGGVVYFDMFTKDKMRLSYNLFASGTMGSSKSTFMKKTLKEHLNRGNHAYGFDKSGEFRALCKEYDGVYMKLGGNDGLINLFQVFPSITDDEGQVDRDASFTEHIGLTLDRFHILSNFPSSSLRDDVNNLLLEFYQSWGIFVGSVEDFTDFEPTDYPTFEDFQEWTTRTSRAKRNEGMAASLEEAYAYLNRLLMKVMNNYRKYFVGHTSFRDLTQTQCAFFDISMIAHDKTTEFDCLFHIANTFIYHTCQRIGRKEKSDYESGNKHWWDIKRCLIVADECQNYLNLKKPYVTSSFAIGMSEGRKFYIGYMLATQLIERMFPKVDNISDSNMAQAGQALSELIGLCQYKVFMKQSDTSIPTLRRYFDNYFRESDYQDMTNFTVTAEEGAKMIMAGATRKPLSMYFEVTPKELALFKGGV